jgi:opacity protein-like surface antigen
MLRNTLAFAIALGTTAGASAAEFYVSGSLGLADTDDLSNDGTFTQDFTTGEVTGVTPPLVIPAGQAVGWTTELDSGTAFGIAGGVRLDNFRIELEYAGASNDVDTHGGVVAGGIALDAIDAGVLLTGNVGDLGTSVGALVADGRGEVETSAFYVNGFYDFDTGSAWTPYVGVGIGTANVEVEYAPSGVGIIDDDDDVLTYQVMGGVAYGFTENLEATGGIRYRVMEEASLNSPLLNASFDIEVESFIYEVGVRYTF